MLAAATETGLLTQLEQALPPPPDPPRLPLAGSPAVRRRLLLTVLFLGAVGLQRTWDLRGYTADGLALLTGRIRAYGYRYTEAFLSQVADVDGAERFTDALASWTTHLWHEPGENTRGAEHPYALTCYVDGHRKPVYSEVLIPRGLIGRLGVILGCRALLLLHDEYGHPLFVTTHRGDQHLTTGVPAFLARYEQRVKSSQVTRLIVDREGMATEFLATLHAQGRSVVTILQTNQYRDLSSFSDVGTFVPLSTDTHGQVIREVAPARIMLSREDHPNKPLRLQVALIRDLRRRVPVPPDPEEAQDPSSRCHRACSNLHPPLACPGKRHQRLPSALGMRHQPRVRQGCCGEFGGHQTTNTLRAAASPPQAMGTERRQTRGTGRPTTGATPKNRSSP